MSGYRNKPSYTAHLNNGFTSQQYGPQLPNRPQAGYVAARPYKKRSGAKFHFKKAEKKGESKTYISGWMLINKGIVSFICAPIKNGEFNKQGEEIVNRKGQKLCKWIVKATFKDTLETKTLNGLYNESTQKLYVMDSNIVLSPNKNYCGFWSVKK